MLDRPPFKVWSAEILVAIAGAVPQTVQQLAEIKGMSPGQVDRYGAVILASVAKAAQTPHDKLLVYPRPKKIEATDGSKERLKHLKIWRDIFSRSIQLDPGIIAPNWLLERIADANPRTVDNLATIPDMRQWQQKLYGAELVTAIR